MRTSTIQPPLGTPLNRSQSLSQGLVGCWLFNEGGGQKAFDSTGINIAPGVLTSGAFFGVNKLGSCVQCDGANDFIDMGAASVLNFSTKMTISYWFKRASGSLVHVNKYLNTGNQKSYILQVFSDNKIYWDVSSNGSNDLYFVQTGTTTSTEWNMVTGTFNGANSTNATKLPCYLNGVPVAGTYPAGTPTSLFQSTANLQVNKYNAGTYGSGMVMNVMLWNRDLSATEVMELYKNSYQMFQ